MLFVPNLIFLSWTSKISPVISVPVRILQGDMSEERFGGRPAEIISAGLPPHVKLPV